MVLKAAKIASRTSFSVPSRLCSTKAFTWPQTKNYFFCKYYRTL